MKKMQNALDKLSSLGLVVFRGFKYKSAREYVRLNRERPCADKAMRRRILTLMPFEPEYDRMFSDPLTTRMVLTPYAERFPAVYALKLGGPDEFCRPGDVEAPAMDTAGVLELLRREKSLILRQNDLGALSEIGILAYDGGVYRLAGKTIAERELTEWLQRLTEGSILCENVLRELPEDCPMTYIAVLNTTAEGPRIVGRSVFRHGENGRLRLYGRQAGAPASAGGEADTLVLDIAARLPELEYLGFRVVETEAGFRLFSIDTGLDLAFYSELPDDLRAYVSGRYARRPRGGWKRLKKYLLAWRAKKLGFVDYMYRNWREGLREDRRFRGTGRKEKRWAHKRGFYSWRIRQYGLTEENYRSVLSDRDYKWLRPINNSFYKWFWNKKISAYVLQPYREYIPSCCFWTCVRAGEWTLRPFMEPGVKGMDDLLALLREKGRLAMKPAEGSHGIGFRELRYAGGRYYMNSTPMGEEAFRREVISCGGDMLISEYVREHERLRAIYPDVVNTVRIMTIRNGAKHFIKHAYLRVGTTATGHTDNLASGGIAAPVRLGDGQIGEPMQLRDHVYTPCEKHPDTGVPIAGTIPHWEKIKAVVEELCRFLYPLEYLGFDVAVTDDGFRILEINTHQDLQQYPLYPDEVKAFFERKLAEKERRNRLSAGKSQ